MLAADLSESGIIVTRIGKGNAPIATGAPSTVAADFQFVLHGSPLTLASVDCATGFAFIAVLGEVGTVPPCRSEAARCSVPRFQVESDCQFADVTVTRKLFDIRKRPAFDLFVVELVHG
jgi:hypothetical protein